VKYVNPATRFNGGPFIIVPDTQQTNVALGDTDPEWNYPTLLNGWVTYSTAWGVPAYRKVNGVVYMRGLIKDGLINTDLFVLPAGYRPGIPMLFITAGFPGGSTSATQGNPIRIDVSPTTGTVHLEAVYGITVNTFPGTNEWISLANISYPAEQ
jgi:hypothetical protein